MDIIIDIDKLRKDLIDYYGTATSFNKTAYLDVIKIEKTSDQELINIAIKNNINLNNYIMDNNHKTR